MKFLHIQVVMPGTIMLERVKCVDMIRPGYSGYFDFLKPMHNDNNSIFRSNLLESTSLQKSLFFAEQHAFQIFFL